MARVSVEVPAELLEPIRETVLMLYEVSAESLHLALKHRALAEARLHQARVDELDDLVRQLRGTERPLGLTAPRDLLHDTLYGALIDAGERLAALSGQGWRGEVPADRIQEAAGEVLSFHSLLGRLESDSPCR